jgi:hypothetical protein
MRRDRGGVAGGLIRLAGIRSLSGLRSAAAPAAGQPPPVAAEVNTSDCNKGLAGGAADAVGWTADTAMNPAVLDAFALVIAAASQQAVYPGIPGHEPDAAQGQQQAQAVTAAMAPVKALREQVSAAGGDTPVGMPVRPVPAARAD